jgi:hypothetical protein
VPFFSWYIAGGFREGKNTQILTGYAEELLVAIPLRAEEVPPVRLVMPDSVLKILTVGTVGATEPPPPPPPVPVPEPLLI